MPDQMTEQQFYQKYGLQSLKHMLSLPTPRLLTFYKKYRYHSLTIGAESELVEYFQVIKEELDNRKHVADSKPTKAKIKRRHVWDL